MNKESSKPQMTIAGEVKSQGASQPVPLFLKMYRILFTVLGPILPKLMGLVAYRLWFKTLRFPLPQKEKDFLKKARHTRMPFEGKEIRVLSWGTGEKQVLLVHGWQGRATQMVYFAEALLKEGYRVIALDGPAHGLSSGNATTIFRFTRAIQHVENKFGVFDAIVSYSLGGLASLRALTKGVKVNRLVTVSTPCHIQFMMEHHFGAMFGIPQRVLKNAEQRFMKRFGENVWYEASAVAYTKRITVPSLVVHDHEDREVPFHQGVAYVQSWHNPPFFVSTTGLGHRRILKDPNVVTLVTRFIKTGKVEN